MQRIPKLAIASLLLASSLPFVAHAQSSGGNIAGEASVGDTVTITGVDTGFRRELKIDKDGKYQVRRVPTGDYMVVLVHKDGSIDPAQAVTVRVGYGETPEPDAPQAGEDVQGPVLRWQHTALSAPVTLTIAPHAADADTGAAP